MSPFKVFAEPVSTKATSLNRLQIMDNHPCCWSHAIHELSFANLRCSVVCVALRFYFAFLSGVFIVQYIAPISILAVLKSWHFIYTNSKYGHNYNEGNGNMHSYHRVRFVVHIANSTTELIFPMYRRCPKSSIVDVPRESATS